MGSNDPLFTDQQIAWLNENVYIPSLSRTQRATLKLTGYMRMWQICEATEAEILCVPSIGRATLANIKRFVSKNRCSLGMRLQPIRGQLDGYRGLKLIRAFADLPEHEQVAARIVYMARGAGMTHEDAASALGCTAHDVDRHLRSAYEKLTRHLGD